MNLDTIGFVIIGAAGKATQNVMAGREGVSCYVAGYSSKRPPKVKSS